MNVIINWIYFTFGMGSAVLNLFNPSFAPLLRLPFVHFLKGDVSLCYFLVRYHYFFIFFLVLAEACSFRRIPDIFFFLLINHWEVNENGIQAYPK